MQLGEIAAGFIRQRKNNHLFIINQFGEIGNVKRQIINRLFAYLCHCFTFISHFLLGGSYDKANRKIKYKNKTISTGLVLGTRKYRWTLKQKYEPCWAKNGTYISELSPHKKNFTVYIPYKELKKNEGKEIKIGDTDTIKIIKLNEVNRTFCDIEILEEKPYEKWKTKRTKTNPVKTDIPEELPI